MHLLASLALTPFLVLPTTSLSIPHVFSNSPLNQQTSPLYPQVNPPTSPSPSHSSTATPLPLIIWHGLGDSIENSGLQSVAHLANHTNPNTYTHLISLGPDGSSDRSATFFGNLTVQIATVCDDLSTHPILSSAPAVNALGFSQGGEFLRAYIQRCNNPPVRNLVTFGSQHNGISKFQDCKTEDWLCYAANALLKSGTWSNFVQSRLVPAQYFRDPEDLEPYLAHSNFLADVNNERLLKNETYKENLKRLNKFAMYVFEEDTTAIPKESGWFDEVNITSGVVTKLRDRKLYTEDWLGLKELDERGALDFMLVEGAGHMEISKEVLVDVFKTYFGPVKEGELEVEWDHGEHRVQNEL
jgi:palmitoyl-protein thioesterase